MNLKTPRHRDTEAQRKSRREKNKGKEPKNKSFSVFAFDLLSFVFPLCLCVSVVRGFRIFLVLCVCGLAWASPADAYLRWRLLEQEKLPDGGSQLTFALESPPQGLPWDALDIVYLSWPMPRSRASSRPHPPAPPEAFRGKAAPDQASFVLYSGRPEGIELNARAEKDGRVYYARSFVYAHGESGRSDPESERLDLAPSWPGFSLVASGGRYYRAQTGSEVILRTELAPAHVKVFDGGHLSALLSARDGGLYRYTPLDDPETGKTWRSAKSLVFAAELPDARTRVSFHLPIFRAYYGKLDYPGGLWMLAASALSALAWVLWQGRKFPWR
jgi:hypothetical protein